MTNYEKVKAWRKLNREKVAAQARRWREKHPDKRKAIVARYKEHNAEAYLGKAAEAARRRRAADPEGQRRRTRAYLERQRQKRVLEAGRPIPDVCEICGEFHIRIVFDHCHKHGHFRGWICDRCNRVLGLVKDSPSTLNLLARYLVNGGSKGSNPQQDSFE